VTSALLMSKLRSSIHRHSLLRIFSILLVIAVSILIFVIRDHVRQLAFYGYPGIFLLSFLAYATVLLPAPGLLFVFTMGLVFHPIGVGLAAGAGAALGELSGYLAGFGTQTIVEKANIYDRLTRWMQINGSLTVLILSALPNPLFDLAGVAAGALRMPVIKFLFWCWIGETIKMILFAYVGSSSLDLFF